jgi:hypothetical protein
LQGYLAPEAPSVRDFPRGGAARLAYRNDSKLIVVGEIRQLAKP